MTKPKPEQQCKELLAYLYEKDNSPKEDIEIIANLLVQVGARHFDDLPDTANRSRDSLFEFVTEHRKRYGETLANALVLQGLLMLNWLTE